MSLNPKPGRAQGWGLGCAATAQGGAAPGIVEVRQRLQQPRHAAHRHAGAQQRRVLRAPVRRSSASSGARLAGGGAWAGVRSGEEGLEVCLVAAQQGRLVVTGGLHLLANPHLQAQRGWGGLGRRGLWSKHHSLVAAGGLGLRPSPKPAWCRGVGSTGGFSPAPHGEDHGGMLQMLGQALPGLGLYPQLHPNPKRGIRGLGLAPPH
jgi:hypothetical protein